MAIKQGVFGEANYQSFYRYTHYQGYLVPGTGVLHIIQVVPGTPDLLLVPVPAPGSPEYQVPLVGEPGTEYHLDLCRCSSTIVLDIHSTLLGYTKENVKFVN